MRVLIAEDEQRLALTVARGLRRGGWAVDVAHDGTAALERVGLVDYDVVVLDRDLPGVHGDDVCRRIVASSRSPRILMLTAAAGVGDRVAGLELGADDYLPKPFAFDELVARLRALQRRSGVASPPVLEHGDLLLDPARRQVERAGAPIALTPKEFGVLEELLRARGAVLSAEDLLHRVWDEHTDPFTNTVRVTLMNLRRKLGEPAVIETVIGAGYRIA
jgi:two-component system, OmpR family, response regulator VanR